MNDYYRDGDDVYEVIHRDEQRNAGTMGGVIFTYTLRNVSTEYLLEGITADGLARMTKIKYEPTDPEAEGLDELRRDFDRWAEEVPYWMAG